MSDPTASPEAVQTDAEIEAAKRAALVDVTSEFEGLNEEDRVFRSPTGYLVKVKTLHDKHGELPRSTPGLNHLSGAIVGADGKALRRDDDTLAVWKLDRTWMHKADRFHPPAAVADRLQRDCALETITAEQHRDLFDTPMEGVATVEAFNARKAAETGPT